MRARCRDLCRASLRLAIHRLLASAVRQNGPSLTPPAANAGPLRGASQFGNLIGVPLALLALAPFLLLYAPVLPLWQLRRRETTDAIIAPRPDAQTCS